tara:strand:- start:8234 stop:8407 length:174 start_codon:yes stop_codon:yes gene_type:complete
MAKMSELFVARGCWLEQWLVNNIGKITQTLMSLAYLWLILKAMALRMTWLLGGQNEA